MLAAGAHHAHREALGAEVIAYGLHSGGVLAEVLDGQAAHGACHLVHQAAGLAKVDVLGEAGYAGVLLGVDDPAVVQRVEGAHQHDLEGRRGRQAAALEHGAGHTGVHAADLIAQIYQPRCDAANQCQGGLLFVVVDGKVAQVHLEGIGEALGVQRHPFIVPGRDGRHGIQVHRRRQHPAVLVVGVVAHHLSAARRGDKGLGLAVEVTAEGLSKAVVAFKLVLPRVERVQARPVPIVPCPDIHISYPLKL